ncbi:thiamine pyrophosphate-binding protein [Paracoccus sp. Z330]|uniref:Thiamine pyrophosphate-binding protein n=1 Tax=Paracoccus onchidii TaxID=3017813 RepID=A0ABT4ZBB6_9RHOB|nr:thiamine pyrophosphate-binding protein [Paracoccus onchidii]MDB6176228.1 thiamine pyrophosphate-binding protein [Paracoccus onchidii]
MRGADLIVKSLAKTGVTRIFSLSGNQIMPIYDACHDAGVEIVHTRHEAAAVYMAEAYAQLTGRVGVAMVTAGAGAGNAVGALLVASESETPLLLLTGDSPVMQDGMGAFQEMPQVQMTAPLTKLSLRPSKAADLGQTVARAIRVAQSGRPGPVHLALGFDVVNERVDDAALPAGPAFQRVPQHPGQGDVASILQAVGAAKRPVVICGPLMNETRFDRLRTLADALDAPVIPMESPRGLRDPALGNIGSVLGQADLIVNLGKRLDFTLAFGKETAFAQDMRWIDIQPDEAEHARTCRNLGKRLSLGIAADIRDTAAALIAAGQGKARNAEWRKQVEAALALRQNGGGQSGQITSAQLCEAVQKHIAHANNSVVICDGGEFGQWAQAMTKGDARVVNGVSGAIGGGLCYGLAARLARPNATVFALMGDGTVGFHLAEFETAARVGVPYVVVIGNDMRWNAEHQIQLRDYGKDRLIGCELSGARYDLAAMALGGHGEYVTDLADLDNALTRAVQSGKPSCVNVMIEGLPAPSGAAH